MNRIPIAEAAPSNRWPPLLSEPLEVPTIDTVPVLRATDYPDGRLARAADRGDLLRLCRGRYTVAPPTPSTWRHARALDLARLRAVADSLPPGFTISAWHAALLHGIPVLDVPPLVDVAAPAKNSSTDTPEGFRRHFRPLSPDDVTTIGNIRVTSYERTVVDILRLGTPAGALVSFDHVLRTLSQANRDDRRGSLIRAEGIRQHYLDLVNGERRRGNRQARAVIHAGHPLAESPAESLCRRAALVVGLPEPELQVPVTIRTGTVYPDLGWKVDLDGVIRAILMEADGAVKYEGPEVTARTFHLEKSRERQLTELGHRVLRFSWAELREPNLRSFRRAVGSIFPGELLGQFQPRRELMTPQERWLL